MNCCHSELAPLLWVAQLDINAQAEAQTQDRNLEKTADSIEGHSVVFYLQALGQVEKLREQSNKLETSECCFVKQRGHKLP